MAAFRLTPANASNLLESRICPAAVASGCDLGVPGREAHAEFVDGQGHLRKYWRLGSRSNRYIQIVAYQLVS